jgi:hypothetical protein
MARKARTFDQLGNYEAFDGGVTQKSLKAWDTFRKLMRDGRTWALMVVVCDPKQMVTYDRRHPSAEHVARLVFTSTSDGIPALEEKEARTFWADGFGWGYGGEGPRGLATVLVDALITFGNLPEECRTRAQERLIQYISRR